MPPKRLSSQSPNLTLRRFTNISEAYSMLREVFANLTILRRNLAVSINEHADRLTPTQSAGIPASTPEDVGLFYINTSTGDVYYSIGTSSSSDWKLLS